MSQVGGLPCPTPSCKPAGGRREVKTRLEEPGGGWRMEVLNNPFDFIQDCLHESESFHLNLSNFQSLVSCGLAGLPHEPVFSQVGGDEITQMKVKVLSLI